MSHPKITSAAFLSLTMLVVLGTAAALAIAWPFAVNAARRQAASLIGESASAKPAEAMANYRLATWLDPSNEAGQLGLARQQVKLGQPEAALVTLDKAGQGSAAADLRIRIEIELGRTDAATGLAQLIALQNAPEAAGRLARVQSGALPLAFELYTEGLPHSSSALLLKQPASFERNMLLARIAIDRHTAADLATASDYLTTAVALNPGDLAAHRLLASVLADRGLADASAQQTKLADLLQAGRP